MAAERSLTDELLADLDDLAEGSSGEDGGDESDAEGRDEGADGAMAVDGASSAPGGGDKVDELDMRDVDVGEVARVYAGRHAQEVLHKLDEALGRPLPEIAGPVEQHPEFKLILQCNKLSTDLDNEGAIVHKYIRDHFGPNFPELESLVINPVEYARTVKLIGNERDIVKVDLASVLPATSVMVVTVAASNREPSQLSPKELARVNEACDLMIALDVALQKIVSFIESRMTFIAPNLTVMLSSGPAAKLIGFAGGLSALSKMPACNIQVLGQVKKQLFGFSAATTNQHIGFIFHAPLVADTPLDYRRKAARILSSKVALAARVDAFGEQRDGSAGRKLLEGVSERVQQWLELPVGKANKALPVPDAAHKKKRGGRRARKEKARLGQTELAKQRNRMTFGVVEEEVFFGEGSEGLGQMTQAGNVRATQIDTKTKVHIKKAHQEQMKKYAGKQNVSGLASSLVFTPVAGLELPTPQAIAAKAAASSSMGPPSDKWFDAAKGFAKVGTSSMPPPSTPTASFK